MTWEVSYSDDAEQDLQGIYDCISDVMIEPLIADDQTNRMMDAVELLESMPLRYRLYEREPWRSKGIRVMPVDNCLVFYLANEIDTTVTIIRIMYGGRNIEKHYNDPEEQANY